VEDAAGEVGGDAGALVADEEAGGAVVDARAEGDRARGVLRGVLDQVDQDLGDRGGIGQDGDVLHRVGLDRQVVRAGAPLEVGAALVEQRAERDTWFLRPLGLTQVAFARHIGVSAQRINEIVCGKRGVTPETAWLLSQALNTSPEFWLKLQAAHDLARTRPRRRIRRVKANR